MSKTFKYVCKEKPKGKHCGVKFSFKGFYKPRFCSNQCNAN